MLTVMNQLTKDIFKITLPTPYQVGPVNTYLVKGEALTLVDTGPNTVEAFHLLKENLRSQNLQPRDIEVVVLTHHHPDHIGLLEKFLPNAKVYAHPKVVPWLKKEKSFLDHVITFYRSLYEIHGVPAPIIQEIEEKKQRYLNYSADCEVDTFLTEGVYLEALPDWTVLETPGHAQSHISLYREKDGVMISGDHIIKHISSNAIIEAPYMGEKERPKTLLQYRTSLEKCLHVSVAYSGHGETVEDPKQLILNRLRDQEKKALQFKKLMGDQPITCFELCKRKYAHIYKQQPDLTLSETLGHLDLLEEKNEIKQVMLDGVIHYEVIA